MPHSYHWLRTGDTFDTLTLSPSIHVLSVSRWDKDNPDDRSKWVAETHWHGWIVNGEVS
jgi:hypothetical protein